jgi:glutathione synthase/RimK-type ligase-like ATP-grasp enzyme
MRNRRNKPRFVIVGNPGGRRVAGFQDALHAAGLPPACVVAWADVLARRVSMADVVRAGDVVRLESPGKDFEVERAILAAGAEEADPADPGERRYARVQRDAVRSLAPDKGRIVSPRQWYLGFCGTLRRLGLQLRQAEPHRLLNDVDDVQVMFDKSACHGRLADAGVAVPPALGTVSGFDELTAGMRERGWRRVFVKLAHGSSASGVVAYQTTSRGPAGSGLQSHHAVTTVEMIRAGGELRLYNSRRLRTYTDVREIAALVDALARHRAHVEQWLPKAGIDGRVFDLRVVVIDGRAKHTVARLSRTPITNLHLLNDRADTSPIRRRMGGEAWHEAMATCERVMGECFPGSLHGGIDLLVSTDFRRHAVLEVNAFGDLLQGVTLDGVDTYTAEIAAVTGARSERAVVAATATATATAMATAIAKETATETATATATAALPLTATAAETATAAHAVEPAEAVA